MVPGAEYNTGGQVYWSCMYVLQLQFFAPPASWPPTRAKQSCRNPQDAGTIGSPVVRPISQTNPSATTKPKSVSDKLTLQYVHMYRPVCLSACLSMCACLSICLSLYLSIELSTYQSSYQPSFKNQAIKQSTNQPTNQAINQPTTHPASQPTNQACK